MITFKFCIPNDEADKFRELCLSYGYAPVTERKESAYINWRIDMPSLGIQAMPDNIVLSLPISDEQASKRMTRNEAGKDLRHRLTMFTQTDRFIMNRMIDPVHRIDWDFLFGLMADNHEIRDQNGKLLFWLCDGNNPPPNPVATFHIKIPKHEQALSKQLIVEVQYPDGLTRAALYHTAENIMNAPDDIPLPEHCLARFPDSNLFYHIEPTDESRLQYRLTELA